LTGLSFDWGELVQVHDGIEIVQIAPDFTASDPVVWSNLCSVDLGLRSQEMRRSLIAASTLVEVPLIGLASLQHNWKVSIPYAVAVQYLPDDIAVTFP